MLFFPKSRNATLPSVEGGLGSMHILKDPPKSVHTYYKPKVGTDNRILNEVGDSGDRLGTTVMKYQRGVNPMTKVSYSNYGMNGGQVYYNGSASTSGISSISRGGQAYLPYGVMIDGEFRPPLQKLEDLRPLSRMPRHKTTASANAAIRRDNPSNFENVKELNVIRDTIQSICVKSTRNLNVDGPKTPDFNVNDLVKFKQLHADAFTNKSDTNYNLNTPNPRVENGIIDKTYFTMTTNPSQNRQAQSLIDFKGNQGISVKDVLQYDVSSNKTNVGKCPDVNYMKVHTSKLPTSSMSTNKSTNGREIISDRRDVKLPPVRQKGGFENQGSIFSNSRNVQQVKPYENSLLKKVLNTLSGRS